MPAYAGIFFDDDVQTVYAWHVFGNMADRLCLTKRRSHLGIAEPGDQRVVKGEEFQDPKGAP
jgi:hypothetical protein